MGKTRSLIVFTCALLLATSVAGHPSHDSFTEIDWNPEGDMLEVSLRIIPETLESALEKYAADGKRIALENTVVSEPAVEAYLIRHFEIRNSQSELMPLALVGMDIDYAESWLYFTVQASSDDSLSLRNTILLALENQQVNRVQRLWRRAADIQLYTQTKPERLLWQGE